MRSTAGRNRAVALLAAACLATAAACGGGGGGKTLSKSDYLAQAKTVCQNITCAPANGGLITKGLIGYLGDNQDPLAKFDATTAQNLLKQFDPDGSNQRVFASGLRNCVGLAVHPLTGDVWCSTNERDDLGDDLVPDFVTRVRDGAPRFVGVLHKRHQKRLRADVEQALDHHHVVPRRTHDR